MGGSRGEVDWAALRQKADGQCDLLTRGQCLTAGLTRHALDWKVASGRWVRLHEKVFLTKPGRDDWHTSAMAALLYALSGAPVADAALAGRSAGLLWGLETRAPGTVQLVVPERRRVVEPSGVRIGRVSRFDGRVDDLAFPWRTTPAATVLDVATDGTPLDALSLVARAIQKEFVTAAELSCEMLARGGHRHSRILKPALSDVADGAESGAEVLYIRDVERAHGLPRATRQSGAGLGAGKRTDNEYQEFRVVVEVDGRLGHEQWSDRVRDGQRDRVLLGSSRLTTRVFFADVAVTPCQTAMQVGSILRTRGWGGRLRPCRRAGCFATTAP